MRQLHSQRPIRIHQATPGHRGIPQYPDLDSPVYFVPEDDGSGRVTVYEAGSDRRIEFVAPCCDQPMSGPVTVTPAGQDRTMIHEWGDTADVEWTCTTPGCEGLSDDNWTGLRFSWDAEHRGADR